MTGDENSKNAEFPVRENFLLILIEDVVIATDRKAAADTQANRRELVRSTFAAIEGMIWAFRIEVASAANDLDLLLPDEERALEESVFQVTSNGSVFKQDRYIPLLPSFRLACRIAQRIDKSIAIDFGGGGWRDMQGALQVRNRVTHPKSLDDLTIDEADLQLCRNALYWLAEVSLTVQSAITVALATFVDQMWEIIAGLKSGHPGILAEYEAARRSLQEDS